MGLGTLRAPVLASSPGSRSGRSGLSRQTCPREPGLSVPLGA